jgi:hypothetical protein
MKVRNPADQEAEVQPEEAEAHGIPATEDQAHQRLAPDEAGDRRVHLAGELADGLPVAARQPGIDLGDHVVPVDEQVERDDRRHHHQRQDAEQRLPAGPERAEKIAEPRRAPADHGAELSLQVGQRQVDAQPVEKRRAARRQQHLELLRIVGDARDETRHVGGDEGDEEQQAQHEKQDEHAQDRQRGQEAAEADALQPVGQRVEKIRQDEAGDEGQQDAAERPQGEDDGGERRQPE